LKGIFIGGQNPALSQAGQKQLAKRMAKAHRHYYKEYDKKPLESSPSFKSFL